jgi:hypothetical protein
MTALTAHAKLAATALIVADLHTVYPGWMAEKVPLHPATFEQDVAKDKR